MIDLSLSHLFKPGACQPQASACLVSLNFSVRMCGCLYVGVSVCVSTPKAMNN